MSDQREKVFLGQEQAHGPSEEQTTLPKRQVLLVDDHPMTRGGLAHLIRQQPDLDICGEAGDRREAMGCLGKTTVDLVITDITMPGGGGVELIHDIRTARPEVPVLVVSMHDEYIYAPRVLRAGARGYVMKEAGAEIILEAVRKVLSGKVYLSSEMSERLLETFGRVDAKEKPTSPGVETLSDRELQIFELIGKGKNTKEIAVHFGISPKTVDVHRSKIRQKLRLDSTTSLLRYAVCWVENRGKEVLE
jgi:DNA-binding NarL/FixJ family response regulator